MDTRTIQQRIEERLSLCKKALGLAWKQADVPLDIQYNQCEIRDFRPGPKQIAEIAGEILALEKALKEQVLKPAEEFARKAKDEEKRVREAQAAVRSAEAEAKRKTTAHKQPAEVPA